MSGSVWLLLTAGAGRATAVPVSAELSLGVHGESVRRVEVAGGGPELRRSAAAAAAEAARILYRERYLDRQILVRFAFADPGTVQGRSAELAFALALAAAVVERRLPPVAATGMLEEGGTVRTVDDIAHKLGAALKVLPEGGAFVFPAAAEPELTPSLRRRAAERGVALVPAQRLEELLARLGLPITGTWLADPFRGLEPFAFAHASIFFGRDAEVAEIAALLARRSAVLVRGPSGAGKSSLVLAGVMPALLRRQDGGEGVRWGLFRPRDIAANPDPVREREALAAALAAAWCHDEEGGLGRAARHGRVPTLDAAAFAAWVGEWGGVRPVWVIDQLEELFEPRLHPATRGALAAFLADANRLGMALLATVTNAALPFLAEIPDLAMRFGIEGQWVLEPRHDAQLLEAVIRGPAAAAGLTFEPGLEAELLAAASHGGADVLPLLELLLTELHERRDPAERRLRMADYRAVGGLDGVVSARAETVYHDLDPAEREAVPLLLWKLDTAGAMATRDFPDGHPIHAVFAAYQARRLLVRDGRGEGGATLRAAHEALLRHWSRAVERRRADEADLRLWADLMREARQSGRGERALIPAGPQLEAARSLVERRTAFWTAGDAPMTDYVACSLRQNRRRRLLTGLGLGLPAAAAAAWGGGAAWRAWRALSETHIAFDEPDVVGKEDIVAADPYLHRLGISISERVPDSTRVLIRTNMSLYQGRAVTPGTGQRFLTAECDPNYTEPLSFTLTFPQPLRRVGFYRAALWPATGSGVTHPSWVAEAVDARGQVIDRVEEELLRSFSDVPGRLFQLGAGFVAALRLTSDYRLGARPFAGFRAILINELVLYH